MIELRFALRAFAFFDGTVTAFTKFNVFSMALATTIAAFLHSVSAVRANMFCISVFHFSPI